MAGVFKTMVLLSLLVTAYAGAANAPKPLPPGMGRYILVWVLMSACTPACITRGSF